MQFFQVGNEYGAAEALRALDDDLANMGAVRDMIDTVTFNGQAASGLGYSRTVPTLSAEAILKTVLGAVVKRLDRARILGEQRANAAMLTPGGR